MNPHIDHQIRRCAILVALAALLVPLAAAGQGTPTSEEIVTEPPTSVPAPEPPTATSEPPTEVPAETIAPPPEAPSTTAFAETPTPLPSEIPTETPSPTPTETPTPTATPRELSIRIERADLSFGAVDASGTVNGAAPGLFAESLSDGAYFVIPAAFVIVVDGGPWAVVCAASGDNDFSHSLIMAGRLEWRLAGQSEWTAFRSPENAPVCLTQPDGGPRTLELDLRLYVASSDAPGFFAVTLDFSVTSLN